MGATTYVSQRLEKERGNPSEFNCVQAKAFTLAQSVLGHIRNKYAGDDVDVEKCSSSFTSELETRLPSQWSGHGQKHDGTFGLPLDGEDEANLITLLAAASGAHSLLKTLAHLRLVLHLLNTQ